jgi:acyl-CoA synthetase (AMP-forming)/AMP-acid ligase II
MPQTYLLKELSRYSIGTWADVIYRNALLFPDREAFVHKTSRVTFSAFNARVNSLAHGLRSMDVKKGDTVGVLSWNCLECADLFGAAAKGRFILSPFSPRLQAKELDYLINYSEVAVLFVGPEMMEIIDSLRPNLSRIKHYVALEASGRMREPYIDYGRLLASHPTSEPM